MHIIHGGAQGGSHLLESRRLLLRQRCQNVHRIVNAIKDTCQLLGMGAGLLHCRSIVFEGSIHLGKLIRNFLRCALDAGQMLIDFTNGQLGLLRQLPYLLGNNRKAPAMLTGTGCLNGGIQSQQVGLVSYAPHRLHQIVDIHGILLQLDNTAMHALQAFLCRRSLLGNRINTVLSVAHCLHALPCLVRGLRGSTCQTHNLIGQGLHNLVHLINPGGNVDILRHDGIQRLGNLGGIVH